MRNLLFSLIGMFLFVSVSIYGQNRTSVYPLNLKANNSASFEKVAQGPLADELVSIPYLPTNVVSKYEVEQLWTNSGVELAHKVMNEALYLGGTFSIQNPAPGISINPASGELSIYGDPNNLVQEGVYTIEYEFGQDVGLQSFYFAPEISTQSISLWENGPNYSSDLTNSFVIDGNSYLFFENSNQGYFIKINNAGTTVLDAIETGAPFISSNTRWNGGVAEIPSNLLQFYNEKITDLFSTDNPIDFRVVKLSTYDRGYIQFDDVLDAQSEIGKRSLWKGRIHFDNFSGNVMGESVDDLNISQVAFSDNGNLFYIRTKLDGTGSELNFIPTLQMLRMAGSADNPVNPASVDPASTDEDFGNLLNSRPIKIYDIGGVNELSIELGDLTIKNPNPLSYTDFQSYVEGFGLTLDKVEGGIWNDNWLTYLDADGIDSKVNGVYSLDENWEFYFTTSENIGTISSPEYQTSTIYKAKLNLDDPSNIKLIVEEKLNLNIGVAITGLGYDTTGCLYFVANDTKFSIVRIYGWGGSCGIPSNITSPFIVVNGLDKVEAEVACLTDTYDLTTTIPEFLKTPATFIHPKGEPYSSDEPVFLPELRDIFDIQFTDANDVLVTDPLNAAVGLYKIKVSPINHPFPTITDTRMVGKFLEDDWFYEVEVFTDTITIDNLLTPASPDSICFESTTSLVQRTELYDPSEYNIKYFDDVDVELIDPETVVAGMYKIQVEHICTGTITVFPYEIRQTVDLALDFIYPDPNCSSVNILPTINSGDVSLGTFAFLDALGNRINIDGSTTIDAVSGEIVLPKADTTYTVQYLALDKSTKGCGDFTLDVNVVIDPNISNPNPADQSVQNDAGLCTAELNLDKPIVADECTTVTELKITIDAVETIVPVDQDTYAFEEGISIVEYTVTDGGGLPIVYSYEVEVIVEPKLNNPDPQNISVSNDAGLCTADLLLTQPDAAVDCVLIEELTITHNGVAEIISPVTSTNYMFKEGESTVNYTIKDGKGNLIPYEYKVLVTIDELISNLDPQDISVSNDAGLCTADLLLTQPLPTVDCVVIEDLTITHNGVVENVVPVTSSNYIFKEGESIVNYTVKDGNGNIIPFDYKVLVTIDALISNLDPQDISVSNDAGLCTADLLLTQPDILVDCVVLEALTISNNGVVENLDPSTTSSYIFKEGESIVSYSIKDGNGVVIPFEYKVLVTIDALISNLDPQDISVSNDAGLCTADLLLTQPDILVDCVVLEALTISNNGLVDNLDPSTTSNYMFKEGESVVSYTIKDGDGVVIPFEYKVLVTIDALISNLNPADITQANDSGNCSALVTLVKPDVLVDCISATDLVITIDGSSVSYDPDVIDTYEFPVGTSTVKYLINDTQGVPIPFEYSVIINDVELPVFSSFPTDVTVNSSPPACESIATWTEPTYSDNCTTGITPVITGVDDIGNDLGSVVNGGVFPYGENTITYTLTDDSGNVTSQSFKIFVTPANPPMIDMASFPADIVQCDPNVALNDVEILVSCGGGSITNSFNQNGANASGLYPYGETTVVTFTVTDDFGVVTDTKELNITIYPELIVEINGPDLVDDGYEFELTSSVTNGPATTYTWSLVSGNATFLRGSENNDVVNLTIEGEAIIRLDITDANACTAFDEFTVKGNGDCEIPNAITPNGDGYNDLFVIPCLDTYQNNVLRVLDRWGQTVYESSNYQNNWDGTGRNGELLTGSFFYTFSSSNKATRSGYVIVVR